MEKELSVTTGKDAGLEPVQIWMQGEAGEEKKSCLSQDLKPSPLEPYQTTTKVS
jgi:hypothetical protein